MDRLMLLKKWLFKNQIWFFLLITLFIYFSFGLNHLNKFETTDESYWIYDRPLNGRIHQYWEAFSQKNWPETFINDKPGVTLAYVSGVALLFKDKPAENAFFVDGYKQYNHAEMQRIYLLFRLPLLIFNGLFSLLIFYFLRRLTGNSWLSLWAFVFTLLSPILLGISQIVNPDSLLWLFSLCTILTFFIFLHEQKNSFLALSSLFWGLSLATKYTAFILYPFLFFSSFLWLIFYQDTSESILSKRLKKLIPGLLLFPFGSLFAFSLLLPAVLADFQLWKTYFETLGANNVLLLIYLVLSFLFLVTIDWIIFKSKILLFISSRKNILRPILEKTVYILAFFFFSFSLLNWSTTHSFIQSIRKISFDTGFGVDFKTKSFFHKLLLENVTLVFSLIPLCLFLLLFLWCYLAWKAKKQPSFLALSLTGFILVFYLLSALRGLLVTARYSIMLFPLCSILAALALWKIQELFSTKTKLVSPTLLTGAVFTLSLVSLFAIQPFYFNYSSLLLNKNSAIHSAWGYGGHEANQFIKSLPNHQNLIIWTDYDGYCPFIEAVCIKGIDGYKSLEKTKGAFEIDYFLRTKRGGEIYKSYVKELKKKHPVQKNPTWRLLIGEKESNHVSIYGAIKKN